MFTTDVQYLWGGGLPPKGSQNNIVDISKSTSLGESMRFGV